jgi:hypothetical protein
MSKWLLSIHGEPVRVLFQHEDRSWVVFPDGRDSVVFTEHYRKWIPAVDDLVTDGNLFYRVFATHQDKVWCWNAFTSYQTKLLEDLSPEGNPAKE